MSQKRALLGVLVATAVIYGPSVFGFWQQDEWTSFAIYLTQYKQVLPTLVGFFRPTVAHFTPLQDIVFYATFLLFKLNYVGYAIESIGFQIVCVYLVYLLSTKLVDSRDAIWIALLFGINSSIHQATTWISATVNTHGASILGLVGLILLLNLREHPNTKKFFLVYMIVFASLLFKEITLGVFLMIPLVLYLFFSDKVKRVAYAAWSIVLGAAYLCFRLLTLLAPRANVEERIVTESQTLSEVAVNVVSFPAKIFTQSIFPTNMLLKFSLFATKALPKTLTGLPGTTQFELFAQTYTLQIVNWIIFMSALFFVVKVFGTKLVQRKALLFGLGFTVVNSFVYALSPGRGGQVPVVDSRNLYFPAIGAILFLVVFLRVVTKDNRKLWIGLCLSFAILHVSYLVKEVIVSARVGQMRKVILEQIKTTYPDLPQSVVFYTTSDSSYYGLPEADKILPFQINFGYTLLVWYLPTEEYSYNMVELGGFLYGLTTEGYKEVDGRGFGYFRNIDKLSNTLKDNRLSPEVVFAFRYDSRLSKITDITTQVRSELVNAAK